MQNLYSEYPEILFIDGTYKLNVEGYPLYPILCQDYDSKAKPVIFGSKTNQLKPSIKNENTCILDDDDPFDNNIVKTCDLDTSKIDDYIVNKNKHDGIM